MKGLLPICLVTLLGCGQPTSGHLEHELSVPRVDQYVENYEQLRMGGELYAAPAMNTYVSAEQDGMVVAGTIPRSDAHIDNAYILKLFEQ